MANLQQLTILKGGVDHWNAWRAENPYTQIDLSGIDFQEAELSQVNFSNANLRDTDFTGADLSFADLQGADLSDAILKGTHLEGSNLLEAVFSSPRGSLSGREAREPAAIYHTRPPVKKTKKTFSKESRVRHALEHPGSRDLTLLFDSNATTEEDMAGAIAFLNDMYVSLGGDQLVITGFENFPYLSAS
jgi:hypothetical protein